MEEDFQGPTQPHLVKYLTLPLFDVLTDLVVNGKSKKVFNAEDFP